ncbi:Protein kinase domain, putative, partial [Trypanosoma cruzi marinkellei]
ERERERERELQTVLYDYSTLPGFSNCLRLSVCVCVCGGVVVFLFFSPAAAAVICCIPSFTFMPLVLFFFCVFAAPLHFSMSEIAQVGNLSGLNAATRSLNRLTESKEGEWSELDQAEPERCFIESHQGSTTPASLCFLSSLGGVQIRTPYNETPIFGATETNKTPCSFTQPNSTVTCSLPPVWYGLPRSTPNSSFRMEPLPEMAMDSLQEMKREKRIWVDPLSSSTLRDSFRGVQLVSFQNETKGSETEVWTSNPVQPLESCKQSRQRCMLWTFQRKALPITPLEAVARCGFHLSAYEKEEIMGFQHVYYCGAHANCAALASMPPSGMKPTMNQPSPLSFDDHDHNYRIIPGGHVGYRFECMEVIGRGTYGIVVRALDHAARPIPKQCALKIAKNLPCYAETLRREADMLDFLWHNKPEVKKWIPQVLARLTFRSHEVLAIPLFGLDIKDLLRVNLFRPLPIALTRAMTAQMVVILQLLSDVNVTHADLKPENIALFDRSLSDLTFPPDIQRQLSLEEKERDRTRLDADGGDDPRYDSPLFLDSVNSLFSSHTKGISGMADSEEIENDEEDNVVTSHIAILDFGAAHVGKSCVFPAQSTFYRAPEVALHLPYGPAIDIWSLGCVVYELTTGVPLFIAESDNELLQRHITVLGMPPPEVIQRLQEMRTSSGSVEEKEGEAEDGKMQDFFASLQVELKRNTERPSAQALNLLQLFHIQEREGGMISNEPTQQMRQQKNHTDTHLLKEAYPLLTATPPSRFDGDVDDDDDTEETVSALLLLDFLFGCLMWDPEERLTPDEAKCHPYLAPYFKKDFMQCDEKAPLVRTRCTGMYYLHTHALTRGEVRILEAAEREYAQRRAKKKVVVNGMRPLTHLNVRHAIQPLRHFTSQRFGDDFSETPLRVSCRSMRPVKSAMGECLQPYTTKFFDPIEQVEVSIMSFDEL